MKTIIIGNGAAGNSAAETIRKYDQHSKVIMIAREEFPAYSACALPDYLSGWINRDQIFIRQYKDYINNGVITRFNQKVTVIDPINQTICLDQDKINYDKLILATGSRAFLPPVPGNHLPGNFTVKSITDIDSIINHHPHRTVVVGSGNIGVEVAEALHTRGCQVTLVELMSRILPRILDDIPARLIQHILIENGISVLTGENVLQVNGHNHVESVTTNNRTITCDTVIWAAGVNQNVEIARTAGIEIGNLGGIKVNSHMGTNINHIYACGDCVESINLLTGKPVLSQLWPNAKRQGQIAALNCLGNPIAYEGSLNMVVEEIFGTSMVSVGLTGDDLKNHPVQVLEDQDEKTYYRVLLVNDLIMGVQTIGITEGWGALTALIKSHTPINEVRRIIADPVLCKKVSWYLPAQRFLGRCL
ncbi:MAG: FAD-dependent oxidoreductase [Syntrophomonas sp.]